MTLFRRLPELARNLCRAREAALREGRTQRAPTITAFVCRRRVGLKFCASFVPTFASAIIVCVCVCVCQLWELPFDGGDTRRQCLKVPADRPSLGWSFVDSMSLKLAQKFGLSATNSNSFGLAQKYS